jgi:YD repeat-containing protein
LGGKVVTNRLRGHNKKCPDATRVRIKNPAGNVQKETLVIFDPAHGNVLTGTADADGAYTSRVYGDSNHPYLPTNVTGKIGDTLDTTYDQYGNVLTITNARGTVTKYTYDYNVFSLGRLIEVEEAYNLLANDPKKRPKTNITYFEPSGLIQSITYPAPGSTGPGGATLTASFTYDLEDNPLAGNRGLGNILTSVRPGNNAAANITTTYDYGPYAEVKLGQPETITVCDTSDPSLTKTKSVVRLEYDERGNLISSTDALGNKVDFTFNIADQLLSTILPSTSQ